MRPKQSGWGTCLRWATLMVVVVAIGGAGRDASAQVLEGWERRTLGQPGLEQAVARFYSDAQQNLLGAYVSRFDSEPNALAAFEAIIATQTDPSWTDSAVEIDTLGPNTRAYASESAVTGNSADMLTVEGPYLYITAFTTYATAVDPVAIATTTIESMIAADAGEGLGEFHLDGTSSGGPWDKLPPGDMESPPGFSVDYDDQAYPEVAETDPEAFDFATLGGIQRAVARTYNGDLAALETPETAPAATYLLSALVVEFDTADHAAAALEPLHAEAQASSAENLSITMDQVEPGDLGDQATASFGVTEADGLRYELVGVTVRADVYLYQVFAVGIGTDTGSQATATAIIEAMIASGAGSGAGSYDESGQSAGGLWDKLPALGDAVLNGLIPESDEAVHP